MHCSKNSKNKNVINHELNKGQGQSFW